MTQNGDRTRAPALRTNGICKSFGATRALHDVGFDVAAGTVHALLGGNGSGKSTLIRILAGVERGDAGTMEASGAGTDATRVTPDWAAAARLRFVHQGAPAFLGLTVAEDFALSAGFGAPALGRVRRAALRRRARAALDRFEIDVPVDARMSELRPATRTMIAVARALRDDEASVLVLDEPTAALPNDEAARLLRAARGYAAQGHTVILVTHRLDEVLSVAGAATFLRDGRHLETRALDGMDERALIERIAGTDQLTRPARPARVASGPCLEVENLAAGPLAGVSLSVARGEIVGLSGLLGSGRSSLLQGLFGARPIRGGTVTLHGKRVDVKDPADAVRLRIAYLPEDRVNDAAFADRTLRENFSIADVGRYWRRLRWRRRKESADARSAIDDYGVVARSAEVILSTLSGGNQQRVMLARWLHLEPRLLLLDEPTQGVDVGARAAIHRLIRKAAEDGAAVIVASSDATELATLCDRVIGLRGGAIAGELSGPDITAGRCLELAHGVKQNREEAVA
jgi:ribose transport system ATP-binding protein